MLDTQTKRKVLRLFPYGLYVVTVRHGDVQNGFTANWVTQSSFDPPLVTVAVENDGRSLPMILGSGAYAVNVLEAGQRELAGSLGRSYRKAPDKLANVATRQGATGVPLLEDALGYVECRLVASYPSGDHTLVVGEIVAAGINREGTPLTLQDAGFRYSG